MADISFKDAITDEATAATTYADERAVVPAGTAAQPLSTASAGGDMEGEYNASDLKLPRVSLVHPLSDPAKEDPSLIGKFLLNKETVLGDAKNPWEMTVLRTKKQYQQMISNEQRDAGVVPLTFDLQKEVLDNGGSFRYGDANCFGDILHVFAAIAKPSAADDTLFPFEGPDGVLYALSVWTLAKTAYTSAGKTLVSAKFAELRGQPFARGKWKVAHETKQKGRNSWFVPTLKFAGKHTDEMVEFFASLTSL